MSNIYKIAGAIRVGRAAAPPSNPENGTIYYDTVTNTFQLYQNGSFEEVDSAAIALHLSNSTGVGHNAEDIDYNRLDVNKKNIQAVSDDVEAALSDLDDAIGALDATPTNYTPADPAIVADHLAGIDAALGAVNVTPEFADDEFRIQDDADATKELAFEVSAITTATTRTITMPDANVNLADIADNTADIADLVTLSGVAANAEDLGTFTGDIIPDASTVKAALQSLETELVDTRDNVDDLITLSGVAENAENLGTFTGTTIPDSSTVKSALQALETEVELKADTTYVDTLAQGLFPKGSVRVATTADITIATALNSGDTIDGVVLANDDLVLVKDQADASENGVYVVSATPARAANFDGAPTNEVKGGDWVYVTAGTANAGTSWVILGVGEKDVGVDDIDFDIFAAQAPVTAGDAISITSGEIDVLYDDVTIGLNANELEVKDNGISAAKVRLANAAYLRWRNNADDGDISALRVNSSDDLELGADLSIGTNALLQGADGIKRGSSSSALIEEEYFDAVSLLAAQTDTVIADFTFAHASFEGAEITFKIKEATSNDVKIGTLRVVTNGTDIDSNEVFIETADTGITFSAVVNGANINIRYSSGANAATMRADVKRFRA